MAYKILMDKNVVPVPAKRGCVLKYPFRELTDVGDAFFIPLEEVTGKDSNKDRAKESTLRSLCVYWGRPERWEDKKKRKFLVRYIKHRSGSYGYQITRTV